MRAADADGQPVPADDTHPDAGQRVRLEIAHPAIDDLGVGIERLDSPGVHAALEVLLRLFVRERAAGHGPERAPRRQRGDAGERDPERGRGVRGKVRRELDGLWAVRAELHGRDGDSVRARMAVGFEDAAPVDDARVPLALFGVYVHVLNRVDGCWGWAMLGAGWGPGEGAR